MTPWSVKTVFYQLNAFAWLNQLSSQYGEPITFANVPQDVLDELALLHVDAVWPLGVWERSAAARQSALNYIDQYRPALPDLTEADVIGSAFAVGRYEVDARLGGRDGLANFRRQLAERGIRMILDFVPNHTATDHPWVHDHPEYYVTGKVEEARKDKFGWFLAQTHRGKRSAFAHGRDPYFPAWIDTAQLNAFSPALRAAARATLLDIASQCDGVRCDMAMLLLNEVFSRTWGHRVGAAPATEYWQDIIPVVKASHPDFLFMAEVYWGLEYQMQLLGFQYTYDKSLYDRLMEGNPQKIRDHFLGSLDFQKQSVRFIENHDEPRAAATVGIRRGRPTAVIAATLPGGLLVQEGQFVGRRVKLPMQIGRAPVEMPNSRLQTFYLNLLFELRHPVYQTDTWRGLTVQPAWPGNSTNQALVAYSWGDQPDDYRLVVVNVTNTHAQGHVSLAHWPGIGDSNWNLRDMLTGKEYPREGKDMAAPGLYVDLEAHRAHIFSFSRLEAPTAQGEITPRVDQITEVK